MQKGDARVLAHKLISEVPAVFGEILFRIAYVRLVTFSPPCYDFSDGDLPASHDCRGGPGTLSREDFTMKGRRKSQET